jgi:hypothetical protein
MWNEIVSHKGIKMRTKISAILLIGILLSCSNSTSTHEEECNLDASYTFNFEQAQYYALPNIDFRFNLGSEWEVRMPEFAKQNFFYYEAARVNDAQNGSVLLRVKPFKREGTYITISEHTSALIYHSLLNAKQDSWVTESKDTVENWWVNYGRYQQEPVDYVIAHHLIPRDSSENSLLLELQMRCPLDSFSIKNERCLDQVIRSFRVHL